MKSSLGIYRDLAGPVGWAEPGRGDLPVDKCRPRYFRGGGHKPRNTIKLEVRDWVYGPLPYKGKVPKKNKRNKTYKC